MACRRGTAAIWTSAAPPPTTTESVLDAANACRTSSLSVPTADERPGSDASAVPVDLFAADAMSDGRRGVDPCAVSATGTTPFCSGALCRSSSQRSSWRPGAGRPRCRRPTGSRARRRPGRPRGPGSWPRRSGGRQPSGQRPSRGWTHARRWPRPGPAPRARSTGSPSAAAASPSSAPPRSDSTPSTPRRSAPRGSRISFQR